MQLPNVLYAETHLPQKTWIEGGSMIELIDHRWDARTRYLEGTTTPIHFGDVFEGVPPIPFRQRLYSLEELAEIYPSVGMSLANAFRGNGKPRPPKDTQFELFVEGRRGESLTRRPPASTTTPGHGCAGLDPVRRAQHRQAGSRLPGREWRVWC